MQIYPEVTTRKLLIVGHSQGAQYGNEMYSYLLAHGEPQQALGVYAVATPASYVAGGGKYLTSTNDQVISAIIAAAAIAVQDGIHIPQPLPANTTLALSAAEQASNIGGHSFTDAYLAGASTQIVSDIGTELSALVPADASPASGLPQGSSTSDCFTPPDASVGYKTQQALFAVADPTATVLKVGAVTTYDAGVVALKTATTFAVGVFQFVADAFTITTSPPSDAQTTEKTLDVANKLYGSSLDGLHAQDKKDLLGSSQGAGVVLSLAQDKSLSMKGGLVEGTSTKAVPPVTAPTTTTSSIFPHSPNGPVFGGGGGGAQNLPAQVGQQTDDISESVTDEVLTDIAASTTSSTDDTHDTETSDISTTTDDTSTTPVVEPPTGAPVVDSFDAYSSDVNISTWSTVPNPNNSFVLFYADDGTADTNTDPNYSGSDCHSGGCIMASGHEGGLGGGGTTAYMYKESGTPQGGGAFTIWARARVGLRGASVNVGLCAGQLLGCTGSNLYWFSDIAPLDDTWHQYYFAWRQGAGTVETCHLKDDTATSNCTWSATDFALGAQFDGVILNGNVVRPDYGDGVWFDDLGDVPTQ